MSFFRSEGSDHEVTFKDLLFIVGVACLCMLLLVIPWIHDPGKENNGDVKFKGAVVAMVTWDDSYHSDVDTWVKAPGDVNAVGHSNKGGLISNLLRDDLGALSDISGQNTETVITRGRPVGEYIYNVHLFRFGASTTSGPGGITVVPPAVPDKLPIVVTVEVYMITPQHNQVPIAVTRVKLRKNFEEVTAMRFRLEEYNGTVRVKPGTMNAVQKSIRAADDIGE